VESEIENLSPEKDEETTLSEKRILAQQSSKIIDGVKNAYSLISDNKVLQNIYLSQKSITKTAAFINNKNISSNLLQANDMLEKAGIEIDEALRKLEEINSLDFDNKDLDKIEDRLFKLRDLARKYRKNPNELAEYLQEIKEKLNLISNYDDIIANKEKELEISKKEFLEFAKKISEIRKKASLKLEKQVNSKLPELKMAGAKFKIEFIEKTENDWNEKGSDKINFLVATNLGQNFSELSKVASGGELSRIMLAIKTAFSKNKSSLCVIFDEIDTGIGGSTAEAVGISLRELAYNSQVISITHQPQVASKAQEHFLVDKMVGKSGTNIIVKKLSEKESNEEIARMISGENITKEARAAAIKLKIVK
jgi:DNA repair protein RecN (Recombination protein N)